LRPLEREIGELAWMLERNRRAIDASSTAGWLRRRIRAARGGLVDRNSQRIVA
jgi:hypothetical protein